MAIVIELVKVTGEWDVVGTDLQWILADQKIETLIGKFIATDNMSYYDADVDGLEILEVFMVKAVNGGMDTVKVQAWVESDGSHAYLSSQGDQDD